MTFPPVPSLNHHDQTLFPWLLSLSQWQQGAVPGDLHGPCNPVVNTSILVKQKQLQQLTRFFTFSLEIDKEGKTQRHTCVMCYCIYPTETETVSFSDAFVTNRMVETV